MILWIILLINIPKLIFSLLEKPLWIPITFVLLINIIGEPDDPFSVETECLIKLSLKFIIIPFANEISSPFGYWIIAIFLFKQSFSFIYSSTSKNSLIKSSFNISIIVKSYSTFVNINLFPF